MLQKVPEAKSLAYSKSTREWWGNKTDSRGPEKKKSLNRKKPSADHYPISFTLQISKH